MSDQPTMICPNTENKQPALLQNLGDVLVFIIYLIELDMIEWPAKSRRAILSSCEDGQIIEQA